MIKHIHDEGRKVAALCGSPSQARKHADAGVDIIIAQGGEAGGHCGEVGSIVLWPQVVKEVAPVPVLAAGGIGSGEQIAAALALGAQGAWTGSQWLMVEEAEHTAVQQQAYANASSRDTVRSRSFTGKPARMLRNDWTEAWEQPEQSEAARNAVAVHGVRHGGRGHPQVPERERRRGVQPRRSGRRSADQGGEVGGGHSALGCRNTSRRRTGWTNSTKPRPSDATASARAVPGRVVAVPVGVRRQVAALQAPRVKCRRVRRRRVRLLEHRAAAPGVRPEARSSARHWGRAVAESAGEARPCR